MIFIGPLQTSWFCDSVILLYRGLYTWGKSGTWTSVEIQILYNITWWRNFFVSFVGRSISLRFMFWFLEGWAILPWSRTTFILILNCYKYSKQDILLSTINTAVFARLNHWQMWARRKWVVWIASKRHYSL